MPKTCKRPAASVPGKAEEQVKKPRLIDGIAQQTAQVSPEGTVKLLCEAAGLVRTDHAEPLEWASSFDGTNMPGYTLGLLRVPAKHSFGSEKAAAAAYFCLKNFAGDGPLYEDCC